MLLIIINIVNIVFLNTEFNFSFDFLYILSIEIIFIYLNIFFLMMIFSEVYIVVCTVLYCIVLRLMYNLEFLLRAKFIDDSISAFIIT